MHGAHPLGGVLAAPDCNSANCHDSQHVNHTDSNRNLTQKLPKLFIPSHLEELATFRTH